MASAAPSVHLKDLIAGAEAAGSPYFALEFFPPRTEDGVINLYKRCPRFKEQGPLYVDVTWGAGGSTSTLTLEICAKLKAEWGLEPNMHVTCTNMPAEKVDIALEGARRAGIFNIVALRGDPPKGAETWSATEGGFTCGLDLVRYIRSRHGDYFGIAVAGYPEGHPDKIKPIAPDRLLSEGEKKRVVLLNDREHVCSDADYEDELTYLKEKVDAGADVIITQMFFDVDTFCQFVADCRRRGITVPIMPGVMLIQSYAGFKRMTAFCKSRVPTYISDLLEANKDDDAKLRAAGIQIGIAMCKALIAAGHLGIHLYTLNLEEVAFGVLRGLGMYKEVEATSVDGSTTASTPSATGVSAPAFGSAAVATA